MNHFHILKQKLLSETEGTDGSLRSHSCAFGGGSSLRKDDEDERTSMLREAPDIELAIVVAVDENDAIGFGQHLLCHLPNDLKYFKHLTTGHSIIMGRLTYQSLPVQPLPHRHNIVLSNNIHYKPRGASKANSIKQALDLAQDDTQIFFVGGDSIYKQAFLFVDTLYVTLIHHRFPRADAYFDGHHSTQFTEVNRIFNEQDEKNPYPHSFITYVRHTPGSTGWHWHARSELAKLLEYKQLQQSSLHHS
jgi:dihydrofolate reductase